MIDALYRLIVRKKFRRWALPADAEERIRRALFICLSDERPLNFVFEFGGYKLWRLPSAPYPDLAERFMLRHYADYLRPVAELYPPGVHMYFASDDVVVERMNNIRADAMEKYAAGFCALLEETRSERPENMLFSYVRLGELYESRGELETELARTYAVNRVRFDTWSPEKKERMLKRAALNFCISGPLAAADLSGISEADYQERLIRGAVFHDAFEDCRKRRAFVLGEDRILLFCTPIPEAVAIGTTRASVTKFWTGVGIREDGLEKVLPPSQWEKREHEKSDCCADKASETL